MKTLKKLYKRAFSEKFRIGLIKTAARIKSTFLLGHNVTCNCCQKSFKRFIPHGNIVRQNAKCPYCLSLERTRVLWFYLQNEIKIDKQPLKILHFAPESCIERNIEKLTNISYISADINPAYAKHVVDITSIPFENESFDLVICSHVLGHVPDENKAISEMYRVLKHNGIALVLTVIKPDSDITIEDKGITKSEDRLKVYGEADLVRLHGKDFAQRLQYPEVCVERIDYKSILKTQGFPIEKYCLGDGNREIIYRCEKK